MTPDQDQTGSTLDTAVVGAGIGGLYMASRLLDGGSPGGTVAVFEGSDRVGGRMLSRRLDGAVGVVAEFGAMRFQTGHRLMTTLVSKLDIATREFPSAGSESLFYLRGCRWTSADTRSNPFRLREEEKGLDPWDLAAQAIRRLVPDLHHLDEERWDDLKSSLELDGRP